MYDRGPILNLSFSLLDINPDEMEKSRNQELQWRKEIRMTFERFVTKIVI